MWFTLGRTGMTEVFYPDLSTPAVRELQLIVSDGTGRPQRLQDVEVRTEQAEERSLTLRQIATGRGWSASLTYVTDPQRATGHCCIQRSAYPSWSYLPCRARKLDAASWPAFLGC